MARALVLSHEPPTDRRTRRGSSVGPEVDRRLAPGGVRRSTHTRSSHGKSTCGYSPMSRRRRNHETCRRGLPRSNRESLQGQPVAQPDMASSARRALLVRSAVGDGALVHIPPLLGEGLRAGRDARDVGILPLDPRSRGRTPLLRLEALSFLVALALLPRLFLLSLQKRISRLCHFRRPPFWCTSSCIA
jgi:hypothetical protein